MRRTVGVGVAALALVAAAGCGSGEDGGGESLPSDSGSKSPSGPQVSGIVVLDKAPAGSDGDSWSISTYDPDSGKSTLGLSMPVTDVQRAPGLGDVDQFSAHQAAINRARFSADWKYAAYAGKDGIHILQLDMQSRSYVPKTVVKPPQASYSGGKVTYYTPQFAPDGHRLWFAAWPSIKARLNGKGEKKLVSVDATSPGEQREELTLPKSENGISWRVLSNGTAASIVPSDPGGLDSVEDSDLYQPNGKPAPEIQDGDVHLRYISAGDQIGYADLEVESTSSSEMRHYASFAAVDEQTVLMRAAPRPAAQYGPVVTVRIDTEQEKVTVEPVAKGGAATLEGVALGQPDKKRVVLVNSDGWFIKKLGTASEPQPLRKPIKREVSITGFKPVVIGWTK